VLAGLVMLTGHVCAQFLFLNRMNIFMIQVRVANHVLCKLELLFRRLRTRVSVNCGCLWMRFMFYASWRTSISVDCGCL
jgi:hypothetical protein